MKIICLFMVLTFQGHASSYRYTFSLLSRILNFPLSIPPHAPGFVINLPLTLVLKGPWARISQSGALLSQPLGGRSARWASGPN